MNFFPAFVFLETDLLDIINPIRPVVFLNTDTLNLKETRTGKHIVNEGEAALVTRIINLLIQCGLAHRDIGVISPYRQQLKVIREEIASYVTGGSVEVDTVDKYQVS